MQICTAFLSVIDDFIEKPLHSHFLLQFCLKSEEVVGNGGLKWGSFPLSSSISSESEEVVGNESAGNGGQQWGSCRPER